MNASETQEQQYLIIGGTTKAATTSLYYYLANHPDICPSTMKETRFFIDQDYPVQSASPIGWATDPDKFDDTFFGDASEKYRLEATPDYLYSIGTPQRIKDNLPNVKVVFLLRDPITRMVSWYKYARQRADIPEGMSFREYAEKQLDHEYFEEAKKHRLELEEEYKNVEQDAGLTVPPAYFYCALEHGRYAAYVQNYLDVLGSDRVRVYCYEDLCANPQQILTDLCAFASLPSDFYNDYDFKVFNRSRKMKSAKLNRAYDSLRSTIRKRTHNLPIHKGLRQLRLWTDPLYYRLNGQSMEKVVIPTDLREKLADYYRADVKSLENMLEKRLPWSIQTTKERVPT